MQDNDNIDISFLYKKTPEFVSARMVLTPKTDYTINLAPASTKLSEVHPNKDTLCGIMENACGIHFGFGVGIKYKKNIRDNMVLKPTNRNRGDKEHFNIIDKFILFDEADAFNPVAINKEYIDANHKKYITVRNYNKFDTLTNFMGDSHNQYKLFQIKKNIYSKDGFNITGDNFHPATYDILYHIYTNTIPSLLEKVDEKYHHLLSNATDAMFVACFIEQKNNSISDIINYFPTFDITNQPYYLYLYGTTAQKKNSTYTIAKREIDNITNIKNNLTNPANNKYFNPIINKPIKVEKISYEGSFIYEILIDKDLYNLYKQQKGKHSLYLGDSDGLCDMYIEDSDNKIKYKYKKESIVDSMDIVAKYGMSVATSLSGIKADDMKESDLIDILKSLSYKMFVSQGNQINNKLYEANIISNPTSFNKPEYLLPHILTNTKSRKDLYNALKNGDLYDKAGKMNTEISSLFCQLTINVKSKPSVVQINKIHYLCQLITLFTDLKISYSYDESNCIIPDLDFDNMVEYINLLKKHPLKYKGYEGIDSKKQKTFDVYAKYGTYIDMPYLTASLMPFAAVHWILTNQSKDILGCKDLGIYVLSSSGKMNYHNLSKTMIKNTKEYIKTDKKQELISDIQHFIQINSDSSVKIAMSNGYDFIKAINNSNIMIYRKIILYLIKNYKHNDDKLKKLFKFILMEKSEKITTDDLEKIKQVGNSIRNTIRATSKENGVMNWKKYENTMQKVCRNIINSRDITSFIRTVMPYNNVRTDIYQLTSKYDFNILTYIFSDSVLNDTYQEQLTYKEISNRLTTLEELIKKHSTTNDINIEEVVK